MCRRRWLIRGVWEDGVIKSVWAEVFDWGWVGVCV